MPTPLVVLFYLWLAVSVVMLVRRMVTRKQRRVPVARSTQGTPMIPTDWAPPEPASTTAPRDVAPADPPSEWKDVAAPQTTAAAAEPPAAPPRPTTSSLPGAGSATLMEALAGITLPCDLVPLTSAEGRVLGYRDLLLITSGHTGFEVGRALGEALEALGYALTPMANNDLVAVRGNDRISITVHDRPEGLLAGKRPEFPTAKPGDTVVELRL